MNKAIRYLCIYLSVYLCTEVTLYNISGNLSIPDLLYVVTCLW